MQQHIPYMLFAAIPAFCAGFVAGGYVVRRYCVVNRWRRTRRMPATEIVAAMKHNAQRKEGAE